ncbi:T9SS type A sorting domain-containing protein, partial [Hymenobacter sp. BT175]|uniref:T9SS type A sorting domain-containing protein n=1 Tax=Hymenobacter translucens TaxID=2886507 RepID=UPI001D0E2EBA
LPSPTVTYATGGLYGATLSLTSTPGGTTSRARAQLLQVSGATTGLAAPLAESFENPGFPNNFAAPDLRNWTVSSTSAAAVPAAWQRANPPGGGLLASDGTGCVWVRSNLLPPNTSSWLTSPNINLSAFSAGNPPVLSFERAYAQRPTPVVESLLVQFSADCGTSWTTAATFFSTALNTMGSLRTNTFVPTAAADWQTLQIPIDPAFIGPRFQLRLQLLSQQGNALYVDNVRLAPASLTSMAGLAARYELRLFPNPATAETSVELRLPAPAPVQVQLSDVLGRQVLAPISTRLPAGRHAVALPGAAQLAPGLYLVQVRTGGQTLSTKLLVR